MLQLTQFGEIVFQKLRVDGSFVIGVGGTYEKGEAQRFIDQVVKNINYTA